MNKTLTHADQYQQLRDEILLHLKAISHLQFGSVTGAGAVFAWLLVHKHATIPAPAWYIAPAILLLSALRSWQLTAQIARIGRYLAMIEEDAFFYHPKLKGWEQYYQTTPGSMHAVLLAIIFWIVAIGAATYGAIVFS